MMRDEYRTSRSFFTGSVRVAIVLAIASGVATIVLMLTG